ncbi:dynamin family protein [Pseudoalteromonas sp. APM04]|uniref:dynamin family protein n=1 Tax=Pseudoalteromonas sp. APM04 TaxID=2699396 RepID=UPI001FB4179F|nr:dynamin family protein [Pseudoalteromonas sp. APM04]UOB72448.1 dynamin family protein [Pseudoalteromonas sp. APM04]
MIEEHSSSLLKISKGYELLGSSLDKNLLAELQALASHFKNDALHTQNENRLLRIGIIGQIKRGKSSFLNSLLFNGQDVLPKAATPMTAALTKICYAQQPKALVEFYSKNEWGKVKNLADKAFTKQASYENALLEYQANKAISQKQGVFIAPPVKPVLSDEEKASIELLNMVKSSGLNVAQYLDTTISLDQVNNNDELVDKLNNYVGASGEFTPIVKSTELHLNIDSLRDIEVVDTPGMNDPIISRGRRTQEFIGQCDVVFVLSNSGQFLDQSDMSLLAQNIPNKGIEDIVLIGSLFDGALLDEYHKYPSIQQALPAITTKLNNQATSNVDKVCNEFSAHHSAEDDNNQSHLMSTLQNALPPIFISSRCYDLAVKPEQSLNEEELHTLNLLNGMFTDFTFNTNTFAAVANFTKVLSKLDTVKAKKEQILADRFNNLLIGSKREVKQKLAQIADDVTYKRKNLLEGDVESLAKKQQEAVKRIESGTVKVNSVFEKYSIQAAKTLTRLLTDINQDAIQVKQVQSQSGSREESYTTSREVSDSSWYNPLSWGSTRTVTSTHYRTVNYTYASVHEAVSKLESFVVDTSKAIYDVSENAIQLGLFKQDIKASIKDMFDFTDDNFDPEMVLMPLNNAVERITIPAVSLDLDAHINTIRQQFSAEQVEGDDIAQLRTEQARVVALLLQDISVELKQCINQIVEKLAKEQSSFIPSLTKDLVASVEQLKQDLTHKEEVLKGYDDVLQKVNTDLATLSTNL